jgi:hypothetical protein
LPEFHRTRAENALNTWCVEEEDTKNSLNEDTQEHNGIDRGCCEGHLSALASEDIAPLDENNSDKERSLSVEEGLNGVANWLITDRRDIS